MAAHSDAGAHCSLATCRRLDFLPFTCNCCGGVYCLDHFRCADHACARATGEENRVLLCPICKRSVPLVGGEDPNVTWQRHERDACGGSRCGQSAPARCPAPGCREMLTASGSLQCPRCGRRVCLKHRYEDAHPCEPSLGSQTGQQRRSLNGGSAAPARSLAAVVATCTAEKARLAALGGRGRGAAAALKSARGPQTASIGRGGRVLAKSATDRNRTASAVGATSAGGLSLARIVARSTTERNKTPAVARTPGAMSSSLGRAASKSTAERGRMPSVFGARCAGESSAMARSATERRSTQASAAIVSGEPSSGRAVAKFTTEIGLTPTAVGAAAAVESSVGRAVVKSATEQSRTPGVGGGRCAGGDGLGGDACPSRDHSRDGLAGATTKRIGCSGVGTGGQHSAIDPNGDGTALPGESAKRRRVGRSGNSDLGGGPSGAAADARNIVEGVWRCQACTMDNAPDRATCAVCDTQRPSCAGFGRWQRLFHARNKVIDVDE
mmetsp:Transcript_51620/g.144239  ORF Transcript_51620/g.144239 Transcript_51620/m.144239 type:complete len:497 (-) Transcript_51620:88-1578(-)